ncbi:hypothetical protein RKD23_000043 [Streptomyces sp. SAI-170]
MKLIAAMVNTYGGMILVWFNNRAADGEDRVVGVDAQSALDQSSTPRAPERMSRSSRSPPPFLVGVQSLGPAAPGPTAGPDGRDAAHERLQALAVVHVRAGDTQGQRQPVPVRD